MIKTFRNKELAALWEGKRTRIQQKMQDRLMIRMQALDAAKHPLDMRMPGWEYHPLWPTERHAVKVNGPWRLTWEWKDGDAILVDFEQYH